MLYPWVKKYLFSIDPEKAHDLIINHLDWMVHMGASRLLVPSLAEDPIEVMGLRFPNTVGLAAGLDKNGSCVSAFGGLGFGHVEVGTVTPKAQPGNPKPRVFRLQSDRSVINNMGSNSHGLSQVLTNLKSAAAFRSRGGILGINIGKNVETDDRYIVEDYLTCMRGVYKHTDYIAMNVSSPNMPGIASVQTQQGYEQLFKAVAEQRKQLQEEGLSYVPIAVKISPDMSNDDILDMCDCLLSEGLDGVIATNTSASCRDNLKSQYRFKKGGISGAALTERSSEVIDLINEEFADELPIIASGGIMSVDDALEKIELGASLVQLYTGLVFEGPELIADCVNAIAQWRDEQDGAMAGQRP